MIKLVATFKIKKSGVTPIKKGKNITALDLGDGLVATPTVSFGIGPKGMDIPDMEEAISQLEGFAPLPIAKPFSPIASSISLS